MSSQAPVLWSSANFTGTLAAVGTSNFTITRKAWPLE
jgi:hypothetical protein